MRVRLPPKSLRVAGEGIISTSLLYGTPPSYTLTVRRDKVYDPETGKYTEPPGEPVSFEVQLNESTRQAGTERQGLETETMLLDGRIVKTPEGTPLEFPEGVKAGDTFALTLLGKSGELTLLPTPDEQGPEERRARGRIFQATFEAVG